jgi:hypothetical protein
MFTTFLQPFCRSGNLSYHKDGTTDANGHGISGNKAAVERYANEVSKYGNEQVLGGTYWKVPLEKDGSLGNIKFANWRCKKFIKKSSK